MYEHRGTFNIVFQVTTAAAVLAAAAHPYQISLFVLLGSFQNHPKVSIVFEIHIYQELCVRPQTYRFRKCTDLQKTPAIIVCESCALEKHNIHAMSQGEPGGHGLRGVRELHSISLMTGSSLNAK